LPFLENVAVGGDNRYSEGVGEVDSKICDLVVTAQDLCNATVTSGEEGFWCWRWYEGS
jgi:hypothetical protein